MEWSVWARRAFLTPATRLILLDAELTQLHRLTRLVSIIMSMSFTDRYTQSQTLLAKLVTTELNTATSRWWRNATNAHLAALAGPIDPMAHVQRDPVQFDDPSGPMTQRNPVAQRNPVTQS